MKPKVIGKLIITCLLLSALFLQTNLQELTKIYKSLNIWYLLLVVFLTFTTMVWSAFKWKVLLDARRHYLSLTKLTKVYFVGLFFNNFFPSSIGGDMMRIYEVGKRINSKSEAAASVILERLLATIGLALVAFIAVIPNASSFRGFGSSILLFFTICFLIMTIFIKPKMLKPLTILKWAWWQKVVTKLRGINTIIQSYRNKPGVLLSVILYSIVFQLIVVAINYYLLAAMGISFISFQECMLLIPIISAISMIPISINGLGVREGAYVMLFAPLGINASQALILSMLFFIIVTLVSLLGGVFFVLEKGKGENVAPRSLN